MIVNESEPVTVVGGGELFDGDLRMAMSLAPILVAADGGANHLLQSGLTPQAVIGDMDSLSQAARAVLPDILLHRIVEQDSTDFDKCLRNIQAPLIIGVGFTGARLDHQFAVLNSLVRHPHQRCLLIGAEEIVFLAPPQMDLPLCAGQTVSLLPFGPVQGQSEGLNWPIQGLHFAPDGRVGSSNRATGPVCLRFDAPRMLVTVPRAALVLVAQTLGALQDSWRAPETQYTDPPQP